MSEIPRSFQTGGRSFCFNCVPLTVFLKKTTYCCTISMFWSIYISIEIPPNFNLVYLKKLKLCLRVWSSIVVAVKYGQLFSQSGLVHLIQDRHRQIVLQSKIGLPMELQHRQNPTFVPSTFSLIETSEMESIFIWRLTYLKKKNRGHKDNLIPLVDSLQIQPAEPVRPAAWHFLFRSASFPPRYPSAAADSTDVWSWHVCFTQKNHKYRQKSGYLTAQVPTFRTKYSLVVVETFISKPPLTVWSWHHQGRILYGRKD